MEKIFIVQILVAIIFILGGGIFAKKTNAYVLQNTSCTVADVIKSCSAECNFFFSAGKKSIGFTCNTVSYTCTDIKNGNCDCNCSDPQVNVECTYNDQSACSFTQSCLMGVCVDNPNLTCVPSCSTTTQCPLGNGGVCDTSGTTPKCDCYSECNPGNNSTCNDDCTLGGTCEADGTCTCAQESIFCTDVGCDATCGENYTGYCIDQDNDPNNGEEYCLCIRGTPVPPPIGRPSYNGPIVEYGTLIKTLFTLLLPIAIGVFGLPLLAINGYKIMTSKGDPAKYQDGIEGLVSAIIGLIFVLLAISLIRILVGSFLGLNILA